MAIGCGHHTASVVIGFAVHQGFPSKPRDTSEGSLLEGTDETEASRAAELRTGVLNLGLAWGLVALCCTHHAGHMLHGTGLHEVTGPGFGSGTGTEGKARVRVTLTMWHQFLTQAALSPYWNPSDILPAACARLQTRARLADAVASHCWAGYAIVIFWAGMTQRRACSCSLTSRSHSSRAASSRCQQ